MIGFRKANKDDNDSLILLQRKCPQGTNLVLGLDSSPDYFARSKPYEDWRVFVAVENDKIIGSAGCAVRDTFVGGRLLKTAFLYGLMVDPQHRRKGIAKKLHTNLEQFALKRDVDLIYLIVTEENIPSMNLVANMGFRRVKDCAVFSLMVYKKHLDTGDGVVRSMVEGDVPKVVDLINNTFHDYDFFAPFEIDDFVEYVERMPFFNLQNIQVLEEDGDVKACLGYWDYNKIVRFTVEKFNWRMKLLSLTTKILGLFTEMPDIPKPGETLKSYSLTTLAYEDIESIARLIEHVDNIALNEGIRFLNMPIDPQSPIATVVSKFKHVKVKLHIFVKKLKWRSLPDFAGRSLNIDVIDV